MASLFSPTLMLGSLQLGLIYGLLALGVFISFRILNIPDLTADGSFTLGLAVSAVCSVAGHPLLGLVLAVLAGCLAGAVTGFLQTKVGVHPILSGILTMSGLYSINLFVMNASSNISLITAKTLFNGALFRLLGKDATSTLVPALIVALAVGLLFWFFKTHLGLCIRATGDNEAMVRASSINVDGIKILALALSNGCVALSGAVLAQYQGYADINTGIGIVVVGLASVIIGEVLFGRRSLSFGLFSAVLGAVVYRFIIAIVLKIGIFPAFALKLVSSIVVALALSVPAVKHALRLRRRKKQGRKEAASC